MPPEEQIASVASILREYGRGCTNGPAGTCAECAHGALLAISRSVGVDLAIVPPNPLVEPLWHLTTDRLANRLRVEAASITYKAGEDVRRSAAETMMVAAARIEATADRA